MRGIIDRLKEAIIPDYRRALEKREFEQYLRAQGWSRKEAQIAVAQKFRKEAAEK